MPFVVKDRVKVTSTTTGTGTFTLGAAVAGFQDFGALTPNSTWNITAASYLQSFNVAAQENSPVGLFFKPDGLKMYVTGYSSDGVYEYDLSTAWNVTTASYLQTFSVASQDTSPDGVFFKPDGTKMYIVGRTNDSVYEYDLSTAWDISSAAYLQLFSVSAQETLPTDLFFKSDGTKMYIIGVTGNDVNEYDLSTPWDISTAVYLQNFSLAGQTSQPVGLFFRPDGLKMYTVGQITDAAFEYTLSSAWNVSSASYVQSFSIAAQDAAPNSIFFKPDGSRMYVAGGDADNILEYVLGESETYYAITDGTDWEIGIGTVTDAGTILSRDTILESSNSNALVNWGAGSKDVFCTFPSDATEGTVPTADNSSVGTDLYAWTNLKKQLDAGVINGVPYANGNMSGMVSTFSLVYTTSSAYRGGVLAPNGDIHFVPEAGVRGQKISSSGTVSTYSLVYTTSAAYRGGVIAANGDIHFVPYNAIRGQKVNASGVVSTYSLAYTTSAPVASYFGGVLAPNGDIHFVPFGAGLAGQVGQKISASGTASTYSLVYTTPSMYAGGVLAPNGDIHFVPYAAAVGQKISAAGVVSTYSLAYTTSFAYIGGVISPNGDVHFVPNSATVGQKISAAGVVSTYSLAYTTADAYQGGVLAPNGDIHFVPSDAAVGQKVSVSGVVSTYALIYTASGAYRGGVLNSQGEIIFISASANRGQKISTNTTRPIGYALSPFFNKSL